MENRIFDPSGDIMLIMSQRERGLESPTEVKIDGSQESIRPEERNMPAVPEVVDIDEDVADENDNDDAQAFEEFLIEEKTEVEVRMLVSSKHLILASTVFKAMLRDGFKEGREFQSKGFLELPLPDDDAATFSILLDIIHHRTRKVPRKVTFNELTVITILVDKYQFQEVVEPYSEHWINRLLPKTFNYFSDDLIVWLSIFWVFGYAEQFKKVTQILERESEGDVTADGLPIPATILEAINKSRKRAISNIFLTLETLISDYRERAICQCPHDLKLECDAMVVGSLLMETTRIGIWPLKSSSNTKLSFSHLCDQIKSMKIPTLCNVGQKNGNYYRWYTRPIHGGSENCCDAKGVIKTRLASLEEQLCGLDIDNFKARKQN
ncbi:hypothetical protein F5884DRAFT_350361 [Xylogone sp. PMI_703]|nr:hypothetical protein F5884DRAFT_350361 [Xylogone sp. PMI_703]